ncbi:MAG: hypothetical protein OJF51_005129 [Nitrospira sp.]|jgi:glycosyltransferase involved in cell wall biosynthesis|nr:MAG: hypothetical protein OJF51_005129 [Nitrospira sp.]
MINVQIVQPLVPEYRVPFFEALARSGQCNIQVFASAMLSGSQSLRSASVDHPFINLNHPCIGYLNHRVLWQKGLRLEERLRRGDVLVVCGNPRFLSNYPLIWRAKRRGIATVWWGIGTMPSQQHFTGMIRRFIMQWADSILLYTDREREEYLGMGFSPDRVFAINNSIDQGPIQRAMREWTPERLAAFQVQETLVGRPVFLFCGRLSKKAQVDLAIEAFAAYLKKDKGALLVIIGDGEERERLKDLAQRFQLVHSIRWLGELYDQQMMAPWFLTAKCFVYPGYIGLSILHAMGYGLPVVTHSNMLNQSPEIVALSDGHNGLLFDENNRDDLFRKMQVLSADESLRRRMSRSATQTATREFSLDSMVQRFLKAVHAAARMRALPPNITGGSLLATIP